MRSYQLTEALKKNNAFLLSSCPCLKKPNKESHDKV